MFTTFKKWLATRKQQRDKRQFERGYAWVMTEYHHNGVSAEDLEFQAYNPFDRDAFDSGADEALRQIGRG